MFAPPQEKVEMTPLDVGRVQAKWPTVDEVEGK